jgi:hypothetical protein
VSRSTRPRARLAAFASAAVAAGLLAPAAAGPAAASVPLPPPALVGPEEARTVLKDVVLDWRDVRGATGYVVEVGTDEEWADEPTWRGTTGVSRLALPTWLPHASYVWRVAAVDGSGTGDWSADGTFTRGWRDRPTPLSPLAGHPQEVLPEFRWTPVPSASEYQVQVSTSQYFDDRASTTSQARPVVQGCFTTRTSVTPHTTQATARNAAAGSCYFELLGDGRPLWWRVRALDHVVDGMKEVGTTPVADEGISHEPPAGPGKLDLTACPVAAPRPDVAPTPSLTGASPAPSTSGSPSPTASAGPAEAGGPQAAPSDTQPREQPCEPANVVEKGPWSPAVPFRSVVTVQADDTGRFRNLPEVATQPLPAGLCSEQGVCRDVPTIRWSPVAGADWYRVYVSLDDAYSNLQEIVETPGTSWTPTTQWRDSTAGAAYHYAVQACTVTGSRPGCGSVTDTPPSFRKASPRVAAAGPAPGSVVAGREVVLSWQPHSQALQAATGAAATSEAYAYRVQVARADNPGFVRSRLVEEVVVDGTVCSPVAGRVPSLSAVQACDALGTAVQRTPPTDVVTWSSSAADEAWPDGELLWRVQAVDASGRGLPWSSSRSLTVDSTGPTAQVAPVSGAPVDGALTVTFSEPVTGVDVRSVFLVSTTANVTLSRDGRSAVVRPAARLIAGASYTLTVTDAVRDLAGNPAQPQTVAVTVDPTLDDSSPALAWGGTWRRMMATDAHGGSATRSEPVRGRPTTVTALVAGSGVRVRGCVGPAGGILEVWSGGRRLSRVDTYRSYSACGVVLTNAPLGRTGNALVQVRGTGERSARSKGTTVSLDALTALSR